MRKTLALLLSMLMLVGSMAGCSSTESSNSGNDVNNNASVNESDSNLGNENDTVSTSMTIDGAYGEVEIPYAPERICVLDMNTMDMIHTLGLGDKVVSLAYNKKHTPYLIEYYSSETIVSLTVSSRDQEEGADPYEAYYSIDADLIIGDTDAVNEELYAVLSQIAPTLVAPDFEGGMYESVMEKSEVIASVWGLDAEIAEIRETYDAKYAQLVEVCEGKTYVVGGGDAEGLSSFRLDTTETESSEKSENSDRGESSSKNESSDRTESSGSSEKSSGGSNKKANTTAINEFLAELKMVNITETAPEEVRTTALAELDNDAAAKKLVEWINSADPASVFVTQRSYETYEDVLNAGYEYLYLDELNANKNGAFAILGTEWTQLSGGLTAMMTMVDQLAAAFLN